MSVKQLSIKNFSKATNPKNGSPYLKLNIPGNVVVMFSGLKCGACKAFDPHYREYSLRRPDIQFTTLVVEYNRNIVQLASGTTTEIRRTPTLIIFSNGSPRAIYNQQTLNAPAFDNFVNSVIQQLQQQARAQSTFIPQQQQNMYTEETHSGANTYNNNAYMPDSQPSRTAMNVASAGRSGSSVANTLHPSMQQCEDDPDKCLIPSNIIPHNMPWEASLS